MRISPLDGYDASNIRVGSKAEPYNGEHETTGERLARLREARGLRQVEVARRLNLSQTAVHAWEYGFSHPRWEHIEPLARILGCSVSLLVTGRESAR